MTRRSRIVLWLCAAAIVLFGAGTGWQIARRLDGANPPAPSAPAAERPAGTAAPGAAVRAARGPALPFAGDATDGTITIAGRVIDIRRQQPVGGVEVVFRGAAGETQTTARRDGSYAIRVAAGAYRAFVRDDAVLSVGRREPVRLPGLPSIETVGVPDDALMTAVVAARDVEGVDLSVVRGGIIAGHVIDRDGRPIAGAVLHAVGGNLRPALATDLAESGADGGFELRLPAGTFELAASHASFAGVASESRTRYVVEPGDRVEATVVLAEGCVITGRVVARDGSPTGDGAIERQWGTGDLEFAPAGQVGPDGTFLWATTEDGDVTLRAWPWKSPPSHSRRFACRDGARFHDVVFRLTDRRADLEGVVVDKAGQPLGFAFLDLRPLDPGGVAQQERSDASGRWQVFDVPPGRYRAIAEVEGRGIATATLVSPRSGVRLELSGTGRLEGTTPHLASGSFELALDSCLDGRDAIPLPQSRRLVAVTGGRFAVDALPACELAFTATWHGHAVAGRTAIPAGGAARVEIDLGLPREKAVHGQVRDETGAPVAGAIVSVTRPDDDPRPASMTRSDAEGGYTIEAFSGASLAATAGGKHGQASVGGANVDAEQVDIVVEPADDDR